MEHISTEIPLYLNTLFLSEDHYKKLPYLEYDIMKTFSLSIIRHLTSHISVSTGNCILGVTLNDTDMTTVLILIQKLLISSSRNKIIRLHQKQLPPALLEKIQWNVVSNRLLQS